MIYPLPSPSKYKTPCSKLTDGEGTGIYQVVRK